MLLILLLFNSFVFDTEINLSIFLFLLIILSLFLPVNNFFPFCFPLFFKPWILLLLLLIKSYPLIRLYFEFLWISSFLLFSKAFLCLNIFSFWLLILILLLLFFTFINRVLKLIFFSRDLLLFKFILLIILLFTHL